MLAAEWTVASSSSSSAACSSYLPAPRARWRSAVPGHGHVAHCSAQLPQHVGVIPVPVTLPCLRSSAHGHCSPQLAYSPKTTKLLMMHSPTDALATAWNVSEDIGRSAEALRRSMGFHHRPWKC